MSRTFQSVILYEDREARSRTFLPLTYTRALAELRTGAFTALERTRAIFANAKIYLHTRPELKSVVAERYGLGVNEVPDGSALLLNVREALAFDPANHWEVYDKLPPEIARDLTLGQIFQRMEPAREDAPKSLWDVLHANAQTIKLDAELWPATSPIVEQANFENCAIIRPENLLIHPSAQIESGVVLDCSEGEVIIEEGVSIMPHATIIGPAFIGKNTIVKIGAKIYGGTSIGPVSKVGGEIENSIIQSYSNKQHDGYLGHSFLGEWVNLGAGTNTSDLKNDYSNVRVTIEDEEFDTRSMFVGLLMGDHSKSAIGTQFNTGTVVGVSCNVLPSGRSPSGFPPKWIPNFSWCGADGMVPYRFEKAMAVARAVATRRGVTLSPEEEKMLGNLDARPQ